MPRWSCISALFVPLVACIVALFLFGNPPARIISSAATPFAPPSPAVAMSSIRRTAPMVFTPSGRHTATVIFIHGLGDSGHGWADAVQHWQGRNNLNHVKFILPHAPAIPITMNGGFQMSGWFDIKSIDALSHLAGGATPDEDEQGIELSRQYIYSLVRDEVAAGIPSERIVVGGFSQGGAMSIYAGLTAPAPIKLGGIVGLSSWLLLNRIFKDRVPADSLNRDTPVFMGHGDRDPLVLYPLAQASERKLTELGYKISFKTYPGMQHSACIEELSDVEAFLQTRLPPQDK
ncbi:acyl-protein thioesterase 1 [Cordyceps fumosorosea ARSEF 2679]|uniref:Acyl-protein thioesterase 1 n=1 Tax=Cordyceps fumosorosea (strain ARSEF 2679) TaxID=1081104 RepID=A0A167VXW9_CORFA|nr:acyl-protein thioesterase 1 [Cordyceps fumosorosea ARSEF 2679]OAA63101.1 acyl-protein thioesterase 1 [Cordyceps fumosorosea ARSEF 2679]